MKIFNFNMRHYILISIFIYIFIFAGSVGNFDSYSEIKNINLSPISMFGSHDISTYVSVLSIIFDGDLQLEKNMADLATPDIGVFQGELYSFFPMGIALLVTPFYLFGWFIGMGQVFGYGSLLIIAILSSILMFRFCRKVVGLSEELSFLTTFVFNFATIALIYSTRLMQHYIFILILFGLLNLFNELIKNESNNKIDYSKYILIGLIYGVSIVFDYPNFFLLFPIILFIILSIWQSFQENRNILSKIFRTLALFLPILFSFVVILFSNNLAFDHPLQTSNRLPMYYKKNYERIFNINEKVVEEKRNATLSIFKLDKMPEGLFINLLKVDKGILFFSPFLLFAFVVLIKYFFNPTRISFLLILLIIFNLGLYSLFNSPSGGWAVGARYSIPTLAILCIFWAKYIEENRKRLSIILINGVLICYSCLSLISVVITKFIINPNENTFYYGIKNLETIINNGLSGSWVYNSLSQFGISLLSYYLFILIIVFSVIIFSLYKVHKKEDTVV